jgi:dipeptidyl aminopeptidase/acylaminoacyl peptidase
MLNHFCFHQKFSIHFMLIKKLIAFVGISTISACMISAIAQKKFEVADLSRITGLSDPQISPDAKSIVVIVSRADTMKNMVNRELVLIDIASRSQKMITFGRTAVSQPQWSPTGQYLSFLATSGQGKEAVNQIFVLPMAGGEARQLTKTTRGVQHYAWSPDEATIAFATQDEPANKADIEKGHTVFEVGNNDMFITSQPTPTHIWMVKTATGEQKRLTSGTWSLPVTIPPGPPSSPLSWSPDNKSILFVKVPNAYSADGRFSTCQILTLADSSIRPLSSRTKAESYPSFSPDGLSIAYFLPKGELNTDIREVWVTSLGGGAGKNMTANADKELYRAIWMPNGKSFLTGGPEQNKHALWIQHLDGKSTKLDLGNVTPNMPFWIDASVGKDGSIAFVGSETAHPAELYYLPSFSAKPIRITGFNDTIATGSTLGKVETIFWDFEGYKQSGIVTYPVNFEKGKKYPLVLVVHGGPASTSVESFSTRSQQLANEGYVVFEPNYRGSNNLGSKYKMAIVQDAGAGPGRDVMAGLAKLKLSGMIDTNRMAVTGWSYGGYMTVWLAGHYNVWKAAVAGAAVTDFVDQYNLGDANVNRGIAIGGSPWVGNIMQKYIDQSPITEARNIKAPTLILANTGDPRVPITQSYKLFHTLKDNGTETRFFAWPIAAHNASDPVSQMDRDRLWIWWLNKYLK